MAVKDAEENERKRIAAELHDNLGVQANAILHNSSLLNTPGTKNETVVTDLQETAKEMLVNLRETLWAMKATDVSTTDLWLRVINFMQQMGRHYTSINFKAEGTIPPAVIIASARALNIVLVLQETVNNAVKHAGATTITATSKSTDTEWIISIQDDGHGFDLKTATDKKDSYGLQNIKERALTSNFKFHVQTSPGIGTTASVCILY
jgi:signal transduction histidine kinase